MQRFFDFDSGLAEACAAEFLTSDAGRAALPMGTTRPANFLRLDGASASDRCVLRMDLGEGGDFVVKLNRMPREAGSTATEYRALRQAARRFDLQPDLGVVEALYLSRDETFMVSRFHKAHTLWERMHHDAPLAELFQHAGRWLSVLHSHGPAEEGQFWPKWIFDRLEQLHARGPQARPARYRPMIRTLRQQVDGLRGRVFPRPFCHGDFHPRNLLIDGDRMLGLDMADAGQKLAVYDIVDFLKSDYRFDASAEEIDAGGVRRHLRAALLQGYGQPVDDALVTFLLRAHMLIRWLEIDKARFADLPFQQNKYRQLEERLDLAFAFT